MRLEVLTDRDDRLTVGASLYVEGEEAPRRIDEVELGGRVPVVRLEGVEAAKQAEALSGVTWRWRPNLCRRATTTGTSWLACA